jgi:hypothetical protein
LYVLPVLLGDGVRFSPAGLPRIDLELVSSARSGAVHDPPVPRPQVIRLVTLDDRQPWFPAWPALARGLAALLVQASGHWQMDRIERVTFPYAVRSPRHASGWR